MRRLVWLGAAFLASAALVSGCGDGAIGTGTAGTATGAGSASAPGSLSKTVEGLDINVAATPSPLQASKETQVQVTLTSGGSKVTDGRVLVTLRHLAMSGSPLTATAESRGEGEYVATLKPTGMSGSHSLKIDVEWKGKPYQATFDKIDVK